MISNAHQIKRVSSFGKIEILRIEFVSIFYTNGHSSHVLRDQINHNLLQTINDAPFLYAFVNMIGGEFIIVDGNI
ncbi:hypothetical protein DDZ16_10075 [Marinilabilia rubra]|uniref:Uncharacterized protein n=1 Tax=Marinilabilia rubra TaxID=2162893 RepID=A0A2U2B8F9_9BACT|nr:hypothetical protein DDZ16_10075 [Marinilabilia rubra]